MLRRRFIITMITMLIIAYLGALAVSTAHLSQLYNLFNTGLPYWVSIGLAVALEVVAFLFSIISTSLGKQAGPWPAWSSTSALVLVWAGNGYAMALAAPTQPILVTIFASCFVPVCTLMVGKVLGGLFNLLDRLGQQEREEEAQRAERPRTPVKRPVAETLPAAPRAAPPAAARQEYETSSTQLPAPLRPAPQSPQSSEMPRVQPTGGYGEPREPIINPEREPPESSYVDRRTLNSSTAAGTSPLPEARRNMTTVTLDELITEANPDLPDADLTPSTGLTPDFEETGERPTSAATPVERPAEQPGAELQPGTALPGTPYAAPEAQDTTQIPAPALEDQIVAELRKRDRLPTAVLAKRLKMSEADLMKICTQMFEDNVLTRVDGEWVVAE